MRIPLIPLLLVSFGFSECSGPAKSVSAMTQLPEEPNISTNSGTTGLIVPGPDPAQQSVQLRNVRSEAAMYAATLPVLDDADGAISLRVTVNPQAHSIKATEGIFAPHLPTVTYRQFGKGIGKYEPTTGRYYFNVAYQKIRRLADGSTDNGDIQEISGWVQPETSTAAVTNKAAL